MADEKDDERLKALEERFVRATWRLSLDEVKRHVNEAVEDCKEIPSHSERASFLRKQEDVLRPWIEALKVGDGIWDLPAAEIELERLTLLRVRTENLAKYTGEGSLGDADGHPDEEPNESTGLPFSDEEAVTTFSPLAKWLPFGKTVLNAEAENRLARRTKGKRWQHMRARLDEKHGAALSKSGLSTADFDSHSLTQINKANRQKKYK